MPSATTPTSTECTNLSIAHCRRRVAAAHEMRHALRVEEERAAAQAETAHACARLERGRSKSAGRQGGHATEEN